jgi:hypothetical protein
MSFFLAFIVVVIIIIAATVFISALHRSKQVHDLVPPEVDQHPGESGDFEGNS